MDDNLHVHFQGPFGWFDDAGIPPLEKAGKRGVYLWTIPTELGELVYYVGETKRSFSERMKEHLKEQLSGMYHIYEPTSFASGVKYVLWSGMYRPDIEEGGLGEFVNRLPKLADSLVGFVHLMRFRVALLDCEDRTRKRIEAALSQHLRQQPEPVGSFQDAGINYSPRKPNEEPILIRCSPTEEIRGLPATIEV